LVETILAARSTNGQMRSSVEAAIHPGTEHRAYPWVLPHVDSPINQTAFLRTAAITARHTRTPHRAGLRLGRSLRNLSTAISGTAEIDPGRPDGVAVRLTTLISLDVDEAAEMIDQLVGRARKHRVEFNYKDIGSTLLFWGDGIEDRSVEHRQNLLADYFYSHG